MNIGVDAAAFGMANAVVASQSDVSSGYWNPAGLVGSDSQQIAIMHASYFAGMAAYDYMAFSKPIDEQTTIGISLLRFGVDDILDTRALIDSDGNIAQTYDQIPRFSNADYGMLFSFSRKLSMSNLSYGINAKIIRRVIGDFAKAWGFGLDFGLRYQSPKQWQYGMMITDITTTYNTWAIDQDIFADLPEDIPQQDQPDEIEITIPKVSLGVAKKMRLGRDYNLLTELDFIFRFEENNDLLSTSSLSVNFAYGFQADYNDLVFLRGGVGNFQRETQIDGREKTTFQPNFGLGFNYKGIQLDYAFTDIGDQSGTLYSNLFSIKIDFNFFR